MKTNLFACRYKDIWKNKAHTDGNFEQRLAQQSPNIDSNEIVVAVSSHSLNIRAREVSLFAFMQ